MTGMRRGEVLGLRWQDVDLDNRSLSVDPDAGRAPLQVGLLGAKDRGGTPPGVAR